MWPFKRKPTPTVEDDIDQARALQDEAKQEMYELSTQGVEVRNLVYRLARRRDQNHFGDELTVSFRPRGAK